MQSFFADPEDPRLKREIREFLRRRRDIEEAPDLSAHTKRREATKLYYLLITQYEPLDDNEAHVEADGFMFDDFEAWLFFGEHFDAGPPLPREATEDQPGKKAKIRTMAKRFARGEAIFHPQDLRADSPVLDRLARNVCRRENGSVWILSTFQVLVCDDDFDEDANDDYMQIPPFLPPLPRPRART